MPMFIKQPKSNEALKRFWNMVEFTEDRLGNCASKKHDFTTILYLSSLIISPRVAYRGSQLLNKLSNMVNSSPESVICLVRTTSPCYFPRNRNRKGNMRDLQEQAIDALRDKCYVVVYTPRWEFLNHAKFLIYYHVCHSERILYDGKYYSSTNLTMAGLGIGNYEEFTVTGPKPKLHLSKNDEYYLNDVQRLIIHEARLYTNIHYLKNYFSEHLRRLGNILGQIEQVLSGTTLGELYEAYINAKIVYNQTFALLDQMPGKKLTRELVKKLEKEVNPPENPFELEMIIPYDIEQAEMIAIDLEFEKQELRSLLRDSARELEDTRRFIKEDYLKVIDEIENYILRRQFS